jgi:hypothetical protein
LKLAALWVLCNLICPRMSAEMPLETCKAWPGVSESDEGVSIVGNHPFKVR